MLSKPVGVGLGVGLIAIAVVAAAAAAPSHSQKAKAAPAGDVRSSHHEFTPLDLMSDSSSPSAAPTTADAVSVPIVKAHKQAPATKRVISGLAANGIPNVALNAYRVAAARMASVEPSCGIQWWLLAGIGREESDHGQFAGATLNPDGTSTPKIIGPALNGDGNQAIPAPPNGAALDGDSVYTHALGPMQFIPQTWDGYGVDASGDGVADIFNINDAALAAARYLCAAGGDLRTAAGQRAAILAYNHSTEYLAQVLALAFAYRAGVAVAGVPVGELTGALPPVQQTGPIPVVNPGPPTAVTVTKHRHPHRHRSQHGSPGRKHSHSSHQPGHRSGGGGAPTSAPTSAARSVPAPKPSAVTSTHALPTPTVSLPVPLPTPSKSHKPKHKKSASASPTPSKSKSCIVNPLGICVP
jgi:membrane-bound lytic murein transglycosylase B